MIDRIQAKSDAKDQLRGYWGNAICAFLVMNIAMGVLGGLLGFIPIIGFVGAIAVSGAGTLGIVIFSLEFANGNKPTLEIIFEGFNNFLKACSLQLLMSLYVFLWSLLLVIPGIIKAIGYSMAFYILAENPEMPITEALAKSQEITRGYKLDLFVVELSFLGWSILCIFTCGIGYLWLVPYMQVTMANIYNQIKE